ncbi:TonB-dependent receptor [Puia dinghuensis]|uniref:TonB-dependent receptor n=1 Tax=Puia dinghuensis TaxID=1792502 RepID=A0A8J2XSH8_9BACT|nr:TonB-dependent receptor [Puia dinghuensis]GGA95322.1 TonB-dependent receptor [Puia dinghuensis]
MNRKLNAFFFLLFCIFCSQSLLAGEPTLFGNLTGTITSKTDGKPIAGATIMVPDLKTGTVSDANGKFTINLSTRGIHLVEVSYVGYGTFYQNVDFGKTSQLDVQLSLSTLETEEIIVTGVSRATEIKRAPIPIVAVGKEYLQQHSAATNIIDAVANLPGVSAVTTGPNISKPFIHGLGYNRVVTAEDGIRQEGQQWGDEHGIEVDQNSIDRIEIIKGPASLSFGSDAIGGVVNLLTPQPVPNGKILGYVSSAYGTNNGLTNSSLRLQGNQNGLVWGVQGSEKLARNYRNPHDGWDYHTNFRETDARAMIGLNKSWGYSYLNASLFDDLQSIPDGSRDSATRAFTKQITDSDTYRPIVPYNELNSYTIPPIHQHVQLYRIYDVSNFALGNGNLIVNLGWQYSHRREFTHPTAPDVPGLNLQLNTYTYDIKYNFTLGDGYETSVGVNGMYQNNTLGYSTAFPIPAYHQFDIGPFLTEKKSFGKLDLMGGIRFDSRSFTGKAAYIDTSVAYYPTLYTGANPTTAPNVAPQFPALSKTFSGVTGSVGGTYNFSDHFLVKANIARGYRAPSIAELSANGPDPGSQLYHVGNSNFQPEFSLQYDFGATLTLPFLTASASFFDNNISNYIFQEQILDASGNPLRVNPDGTPNPNGLYAEFGYVQTKARIDGGEFYLDIHPVSWLHFENSMTLTYGTNLSNNGHAADSIKYLPFIPPLHTHSELRAVDHKGFGIFKNGYAYVGFDHYNAQDRFFAAFGTETYTDGYNLVSAGLGVDLVNAAGKKIAQIFIEGTNLGNVSYQSNMSRLKYFDSPNVPPNITPGMFNMGQNFTFKVIVPFDLSPKAK